MKYPSPVQDRQRVYMAAFDKRIRERLRALVSEEIIEEHRRKPVGQHSDALERLLNYFRRGALKGKLGLFQADPNVPRYQMVRFSGSSSVPPVVEGNEVFESLDAAYHAVFLRRIAELMADNPKEVP